ncbi:MAG: DUF1127 domain-containing protein [Proteobacteria bacterium]|nr:DUF1127 domain-containing protein [Pseudomonadota bacterium]
MTDRLANRIPAPAPSAPRNDGPPAGLLAGLALRLSDWRRRARYARAFRGFDDRQLRDLGLSPFDQFDQW